MHGNRFAIAFATLAVCAATACGGDQATQPQAPENSSSDTTGSAAAAPAAGTAAPAASTAAPTPAPAGS